MKKSISYLVCAPVFPASIFGGWPPIHLLKLLCDPCSYLLVPLLPAASFTITLLPSAYGTESIEKTTRSSAYTPVAGGTGYSMGYESGYLLLCGKETEIQGFLPR